MYTFSAYEGRLADKKATGRRHRGVCIRLRRCCAPVGAYDDFVEKRFSPAVGNVFRRISFGTRAYCTHAGTQQFTVIVSFSSFVRRSRLCRGVRKLPKNSPPPPPRPIQNYSRRSRSFSFMPLLFATVRTPKSRFGAPERLHAVGHHTTRFLRPPSLARLMTIVYRRRDVAYVGETVRIRRSLGFF